MDVRDTLNIHMNYIVGCFFKNVGGDESLIMDEMYKLIENDIGVNFDAERFFFLNYDKIDNSKLYFDIDCNSTPKELLRMITNMVELRRMEQNIKNKVNLIHFRGFKGKVYLETQEQTLRVEAYLQLHNYIRNPFATIRVDLIKRLLDIKEKMKNEDNAEETLIVSYRIQMYRLMVVLKAIEECTSQLS